MSPRTAEVAVLLLLLAEELFGCTPAAAPYGGEGCAPACARIRECKLGRTTTADGATCEQVCDAVTREGVNFGAACLARAATCDEARACP